MKYTITLYSFNRHMIISTDEFEGSDIDAFNNFNGYVNERDRLYPDEKVSITCTSEGEIMFSAMVGKKNEFESLGEGEGVTLTISYFSSKGEDRPSNGGEIKIDAIGIHSTGFPKFSTFEELGHAVAEALHKAVEAKRRFKEMEAEKLAKAAEPPSDDDDVDYWE